MKFQDKGRGLIIYLLKHISTKTFPCNSESETRERHLAFSF